MLTKVKSQLHARIKDGYTSKDFIKAFDTIKSDPYHIESNYRFLTPEFITREVKLDKWVNVEKEEEVKSGGVSMMEMYESDPYWIEQNKLENGDT